MEQFDATVIEKIVHQLKSQGIFDQFRKECMSDVDTKPAYQNLRQRVDGSISGFLSTYQWRPDLNKNQLRDTLRKHIQNSGFLDVGVERIVDQVVNPKICPLFLPKVEEVVYDCLGLNKPGGPEKAGSSTTSKIDVTLNFPSISGVNEEKKEKSVQDDVIKLKQAFNVANLLPQGLEPVSPPSEDKLVETNESEEIGEEEEVSPPFEPHNDGNSDDSHPSLHLENDAYCVLGSKHNTINSDDHNKKSTKREENFTNIEVEPSDLQSCKIKSSKHYTVVTSQVTGNITFKKTSPKFDDDTSSVEPETSTGSSLGTTSDELISSQEKECTPNRDLKLKNFSQDSDDEVIYDSSTVEGQLKSEQYKKPQVKHSSSSSHQRKRSSSSKSSSKDHRSHHRHDDKKSSYSSSYNSKVSNKPKYTETKKEEKIIDKKEKRHESIRIKHKTKLKSKDEKIKCDKYKTGHKSQTKDLQCLNGNDLIKYHKDKLKTINLNLRDNIESDRGDSHFENKHDKQQHSYKSLKKEDHSWNGNEQTSVSISSIKDDKKTIDRDKRREISKAKHSKKHCKSSEKFREGRRSSDRDSNGQGEGSNTTDSNVSSQSQCQSQSSPGKDKNSQTSKNNIVCDSQEVDLNYSNSVLTYKQYKGKGYEREHKMLTLKSSIKKKHSNVYEVRKKIQAHRSLERLRRKREKSNKHLILTFKRDNSDNERRKLTEYAKIASVDDSDNSPSREMMTWDSDQYKPTNNIFETKDDLLKQQNFTKRVQLSVANTHHDKTHSTLTKAKKLCKSPSFHISNNSSQEIKNVKTNLEQDIKVQNQFRTESSAKEIFINQENKPEKVVIKKNQNSDFALVKLNSESNMISIIPMGSEFIPVEQIPTIRSVTDVKKSSKAKPDSDKKFKLKSTEYKQEKKSHKKKSCTTQRCETVTNNSQKQSIVGFKERNASTLDTKFDNSRQNKVLKVINQDVRSESRYDDFSPEKDSRYGIQVVEEDLFPSQGYNNSQNDTEEYSTSKPPKLATKLVDVALQDLLMESGLSLACRNEGQEKLNTSSQHGSSTNLKRLKLVSEKPQTLHQQQHYDKSDLYKPRPQFTQSSKRTRKVQDDSSEDTVHKISRR